MQEIRIHGRGGQGAVMAGEILVSALVREGKSGASFPTFGMERRGAPVTAFVRLDTVAIRERMQIYEPDCLLVLDTVQIKWPQTFAGVKQGSSLVVNSSHSLSDRPHNNIMLAGVINATQISLQEIGRDAVNTCMLGAFAAATGWVGLGSLTAAFEDYFDKRIIDGNIRAAQRGFNEVEVQKW